MQLDILLRIQMFGFIENYSLCRVGISWKVETVSLLLGHKLHVHRNSGEFERLQN